MATGDGAAAGGGSASARAFVYISNAEDGDISSFRLHDTGELTPIDRTKVAGMVMPMAVSPDRRFLYAAARSNPFTVYTYAIDPVTGALAQVSTSPLADSFPYISLDRTGSYLLAASYHGNLVTVNAVGSNGHVSAEPSQAIEVGNNAHSIRVDRANRHVYVPALGSDAIFVFDFDAATGKLAPATPAAFFTKPATGPRHFEMSPDGRYLFVLGEFTADVITLAIDAGTGRLSQASSASCLPPGTKLVPGAARGSIPGRNLDNDIWAADVHITPDGRFIYASERTSSTIGALAIDAATGKLTYLSSTPTEQQPRGFAIDPVGRFLVATGEKSDNASVYAIDGTTGALTPVAKAPVGKGANWVEIVRFD